MQDKRKMPVSLGDPQGSSTSRVGGNRSSAHGRHQPPSVDSERGNVEIPVGALVRYIGTMNRTSFDDWQTDYAIVLDRKMFCRTDVVGPQPNPGVWPPEVAMLLIQWLQEGGLSVDERWKPRVWKEVSEPGAPCLVSMPGWKAGRGPVWVLEENHVHSSFKTSRCPYWEVIE